MNEIKTQFDTSLIFCSYNSPKKKQFVGLLIKKKFLKQLKLKKKKKIEAIKCCNKIKLKMLDY